MKALGYQVCIRVTRSIHSPPYRSEVAEEVDVLIEAPFISSKPGILPNFGGWSSGATTGSTCVARRLRR